MNCRKVWQAIAPVGTLRLECPECGTEKGYFKYEFIPEVLRECNCGNQLFYLTPDGHLCPNCGVLQDYE